jgi:uncharacterized protein YjbI with pentapeptide repeats
MVRYGLFVAAGVLVLIALAGGAVSLLLLDADPTGVVVNLSTEFLSIAVTVLVIDRLVAVRDKQKLKEQLIRQMGSRSNVFTLSAVPEIRAYGWLTDGSLREADLGKANLEDADLREADLQAARLFFANLSVANLGGANLSEANLDTADLRAANLQDADLTMAGLRGARLNGAKLQRVNLRQANLQGADLWLANLQEAQLHQVNLRESHLRHADLQGANLNGADLHGAHLPDGSMWTPNADMARFTDPEHPEFWRSDHPDSPAYRGDDGGA